MRIEIVRTGGEERVEINDYRFALGLRSEGRCITSFVEGGYIVTAESAISLTTKKGFYLLVQATRLPYKTGL